MSTSVVLPWILLGQHLRACAAVPFDVCSFETQASSEEASFLQRRGAVEVLEASSSKQRVHVLQIGDEKSFNEYDVWVKTVKRFGTKVGYTYHAEVLKAGQEQLWYHWQKPVIINRMLGSLPHGDILLFMDLDVAVDYAALMKHVEQAPSSMSALQQISDAMRSINSFGDLMFGRTMNCSFMGQDGRHTLNSGVLMFLASDEGRKLAGLWETRMLSSKAPMDQIALQSAILHLAASDYHDECESMTPDGANECYNSFMTRAGMPRDHRSFGTYCLLSRDLHLSMHDDDNHYQQGDVFYHGKDSNMSELMLHTWNSSKTDATTLRSAHAGDGVGGKTL